MAKCPRKINDKLYRDEWQWQEGDLTVTRNTQWSGPGCHNGCGVLHYTDQDGKLVKIEGDPKSPMFNGRLCMRCLAVPEAENHPNRIYRPQKRIGERGENKWQEITWDEAYDTIVSEVKRITAEYGAKSIFTMVGTGRNAGWQAHALCNSIFDSPNVGFGFLSGESCYVPRIAAMAMMGGAIQVMDCAQVLEQGYDDPEYVVPEICLIWANNPIVSNADGFLGHWIIDLMRMGMKLIVVDPRMSWLGAQAEMQLMLRPGTDAALALGFMNVIIGEDLYDHDFCENWTYGFDELKARVEEYPVEKVADITGVPAEKIVAAARRYAMAKPAAVQWGLKLDQQTDGMGATQALQCLWAITGNVDVPGGNIIVNTGYIQNDARRLVVKDVTDVDQRFGNDVFPLRKMGVTEMSSTDILIEALETGKPYPIKMLYLQSTNCLANMAADPKRCMKGMLTCDFIVVSDYYMTPTSVAAADIFLPLGMSTERVGCRGWYNPLRTINKIHETEAHTDEQIILDIGKRVNPDATPWDTPEEFWEDVMRHLETIKVPEDFSYKKLQEDMYFWQPTAYRKYEKGLLRSDGEPGFNTPTGLFELKSTMLEAAGVDPLPYYKEPDPSPVSNPDYAAEYPLICTTGRRSWEFFHSEHRNLRSMREFHRWPRVEMTQEIADRYGIKEGDWVLIENAQGSAREICAINPKMAPNTICAEHGWWFPEQEAAAPNLFGVYDVNINQLVPMQKEGPSGFGAPYTTQMCRISKCVDYHPEYPGEGHYDNVAHFTL